MLKIELTSKSKQLMRKVMERTDPKTFYSRLDKFFAKISLWVAGQVSEKKLSGDPLKRRTGALAQSITGRSVREKGVIGFRVGVFRGPALAYAGIHEYGTKGKNPASPFNTIKPRNARSLAMPINSAITPAGVARYKGPRDYAILKEQLVFIPYRKSSNAVGALFPVSELKRAKTTDFSSAKAAYLLLKKVDLKPTWYLTNGVRDTMPTVVRELGKEFQSMLRMP